MAHIINLSVLILYKILPHVCYTHMCVLFTQRNTVSIDLFSFIFFNHPNLDPSYSINITNYIYGTTFFQNKKQE